MRPIYDKVADGFVAALVSSGCTENAGGRSTIVEIHLRPAAENMVILRRIKVDLQVALIVVEVVSTVVIEVVAIERVNWWQRIVCGRCHDVRSYLVRQKPGRSEIIIGKRQ